MQYRNVGILADASCPASTTFGIAKYGDETRAHPLVQHHIINEPSSPGGIIGI